MKKIMKNGFMFIMFHMIDEMHNNMFMISGFEHDMVYWIFWMQSEMKEK